MAERADVAGPRAITWPDGVDVAALEGEITGLEGAFEAFDVTTLSHWITVTPEEEADARWLRLMLRTHIEGPAGRAAFGAFRRVARIRRWYVARKGH